VIAMIKLLADSLVLFHFLFVAFAVLGVLLVLRWRKLVWLHVPCALWAIYVEFSGRLCPLTEYENSLRKQAGEAGYSGGFIEHYILPVLYPDGLTRDVQLWLGVIVLTVNVVGYAVFVWRGMRKAETPRLLA
jgi:hypothetical protein